MLHIYTGRENIDKERFIYEHVGGETLVVVPDQYTLIAEEQALHYLGVSCLLDVEILSMSRLGLRMLEEQGLEHVRRLGKYERHMILARIIRSQREDLEVFRDAAGKKGFVEMVNNFIADFKQQDCSAEEMAAMIEDAETDELLRKKLKEIEQIVAAYEAAIADKYTDSEDYIALYTKAIGASTSLADKTVWVYGFDSMTPKFMGAVAELAKVAKDVNVVVNESDFGLDRLLIRALRDTAADCGITSDVQAIDGDILPKTETIRKIEAELFAPASPVKAPSKEPKTPDNLTVVECANPYYEAENAAITVYRWLREGYRMRDIAIICNDTGSMQPIIQRTFDEYGLPIFVDATRSVTDSPVVSFVMNLLDILQYGYRTQSVIALLKTGLAGVERTAVWELDNYARQYQIRWSMWSRPFKYGAMQYGEEEFGVLEAIRAEVIGKIEVLRETAKGAETVRDFGRRFYNYLNEVWNIKGQIEAIRDAQYEKGYHEASQWTAQSYNAVIEILDCIQDVIGDSALDVSEFCELYGEGIRSIEMGMIPPTQDGLSIGTMIRSRPAPPKAVLIIGANEGVLPMEPSPEGLFSVDEKAFFEKNAFPLGRLDDLQLLEENVAMYRTVAKASEKLYISYSLSDTDGGDRKPSTLITSIKGLFPGVKVERDLVSAGFGKELVQSGPVALRHMMNYFKERPSEQMADILAEAGTAGAEGTGGGIPASAGAAGAAAERDYIAEAVMRWYEANDPETLEHLRRAGCDENFAEPLAGELASRLYARGDGAYSLSSSRLEKFDHCPFQHFVQYGLRAEEMRVFKSTSREIGDIYHECIMKVSKRLMAILMEEPEAESVSNGERAANAGTDDTANETAESLYNLDIDGMVDEELIALSENYREGLFAMDGREEYRMNRIRKICADAVRVLAEQFRLGKIKTSYFEEGFGRGCVFAPIEHEINGHKVYIEGKIDRADVMTDGNVRIVDYKTGKDQLDIEQMRTGYKMQLMVYLEGATGRELGPAGMFYLNIKDDMVNLTGKTTDGQEKEIQRQDDSRFKLAGAYIDEPTIVDSMPREMLSKSSKGLPREDFEQLEKDVRDSIERLSEGIVSGDIRIEPTRTKSKKNTPCQYCDYHSICKFDPSYRNNKYRTV